MSIDWLYTIGAILGIVVSLCVVVSYFYKGATFLRRKHPDYNWNALWSQRGFFLYFSLCACVLFFISSAQVRPSPRFFYFAASIIFFEIVFTLRQNVNHIGIEKRIAEVSEGTLKKEELYIEIKEITQGNLLVTLFRILLLSLFLIRLYIYITE